MTSASTNDFGFDFRPEWTDLAQAPPRKPMPEILLDDSWDETTRQTLAVLEKAMVRLFHDEDAAGRVQTQLFVLRRRAEDSGVVAIWGNYSYAFVSLLNDGLPLTRAHWNVLADLDFEPSPDGPELWMGVGLDARDPEPAWRLAARVGVITQLAIYEPLGLSKGMSAGPLLFDPFG